MAENDQKRSDEEEDGDNPFSFNSFMQKSKTEKNKSSDDDSSSKDAKKKSKVNNENPFSFREFIRKDPPSASGSPKLREAHSSKPVTQQSEFSNELPDFMQDQLQFDLRAGLDSSRLRTHSDISLPDFTLNAETAPSTADTSYSGVFPSINAIGSLIGGREETGPSYRSNQSRPNSSTSDIQRPLPDFLTDTTAGTERDDVTTAEDESQRSLLTENRRLINENRLLRRQVLEARELAHSESTRVAQLLSQVELLQRREADETSALENMVQQVESNLRKTTDRAVKAENLLLKQKQEIQVLKAEVLHLREDRADSYDDDAMTDVRERTQYVSEQLGAAALNAEISLKQMLEGVQNLKLMSEIMLSIGKISEEPVQDDANEDVPVERESDKTDNIASDGSKSSNNQKPNLDKDNSKTTKSKVASDLGAKPKSSAAASASSIKERAKTKAASKKNEPKKT